MMEDLTILNRGRKTSLKRFEQDLIELGLLRLTGVAKKNLKEKDIHIFIENFLKCYNKVYNTINTKTRKLQTMANRRRSAGDIFRLCKYYFPNCTFVEVLKSLSLTTLKVGYCSSICSTIHKRVYRSYTPIIWSRPEENERGIIYNPNMKDEFGRIPDDYLKL